jgi:hypothetical protein
MKRETEAVKPYRSFPEEPTEFTGTDMKVHVTQMRKNDRFQHRKKGWVTVQTVEPRRTRVKLEFVDRFGNPGEGYPVMDLQEDVPIVRQEETDEHRLWRLEEELAELVHRSASDARRRYEKERDSLVNFVKSSGVQRALEVDGSDAVKAQAIADLYRRLEDALRRDPDPNKGRPSYLSRQAEEDRIAGDPATTVRWFHTEEVRRLVHDASHHGSSMYRERVVDTFHSLEVGAIASELDSTWNSSVKAMLKKANEILKLRDELKLDLPKDGDDDKEDVR